MKVFWARVGMLLLKYVMNGASKQSFILLPSNGIEVVFST